MVSGHGAPPHRRQVVRRIAGRAGDQHQRDGQHGKAGRLVICLS
jgi:hypothetical protein